MANENTTNAGNGEPQNSGNSATSTSGTSSTATDDKSTASTGSANSEKPRLTMNLMDSPQRNSDAYYRKPKVDVKPWTRTEGNSL